MYYFALLFCCYKVHTVSKNYLVDTSFKVRLVVYNYKSYFKTINYYMKPTLMYFDKNTDVIFQ